MDKNNLDKKMVCNHIVYKGNDFLLSKNNELLTILANNDVIVIPDIVESISQSAFHNCYSCKAIVFPKSLKSLPYPLELPSNDKLKTVLLPEDLISIPNGYFKDFVGLKKVVLPKMLSVIPDDLFYNCKSLFDVTLPENLQKINANAFYKCKSLKKIILPETLSYIGHSAFSNCLNLNDISFPRIMHTISEYAFYCCANLKDINLPEKLSVIGDRAFAYCENLESVVYPEIGYISDGCFLSCKNLKTVQLQKNLTEIYNFAFDHCYSLENINITQGITEISSYAFHNCNNLKEIVLPDSLENIGFSAFEGCEFLESVVLPKNLQTINKDIFKNCINLKHINLPDCVSSIDDSAFEGCESMEHIVLPKNLKSVGDFSFANTSLNYVEIPKNLEQVHENCFNGVLNIKIPYDAKVSIILKLLNSFDYSDIYNVAIDNENNFIINYSSTENIDSISVCLSLDMVNIFLNNEFTKALKLADINNKFSKSQIYDISRIVNYFKMLKNLNSYTYSIMDSLDSSEQEKVFKSLNNIKHFNVFKSIRNYLYDSDYKNFVDFVNFKFYDKLDFGGQFLDPFYEDIFILFYYSMGGFGCVDKINNKILPQKVGEFFINKVNKNEIDLKELVKSIFINSEDFKYYMFKFNLERSNFFLGKSFNVSNAQDNLDIMMGLDFDEPGFLSFAFKNFKICQKSNTSNRGSQRVLKPTIDHILKCFHGKVEEFDLERYGLDDTQENRYLLKKLKEVKDYIITDGDVKKSISILKEQKNFKIPKSLIVGEIDSRKVLKNTDEKVDIISDFDKKSLLENEKNNGYKLGFNQNILSKSNNLLLNDYTYELLPKDSPINLILGKLCDCCAHINGAGYGIMRASIVSPYVQNIVIRNSDGEIVAKSTIYVNSEEGYAVCNNVEVNIHSNNCNKLAIFKKYMECISKFCYMYNMQNPDKKIKQVNVGMNSTNDLSYFIRNNCLTALKLLPNIDYSLFGVSGQDYAGDANEKQSILYLLKKYKLNEEKCRGHHIYHITNNHNIDIFENDFEKEKTM